MKQKDIALILVLVFISGIISFVVSGAVFGGSTAKNQTAKSVDTITSDFPPPDSKYFNTNSIDPTQLIQIGNANNPNPFNGSQ